MPRDADRSESPDASEEQDAVSEPRPCPACRGTGSVVSKLGGTQSDLPCPWCEGTGTVIPGHDAQAARRERLGSEPAAPEPPPPAA